MSTRSTARGFVILVLVTFFKDRVFAQEAVADLSEYTWVVVYAGIFAFFASYGIGANDVANAFASSVGAKSLTMRQAVCLGAVFEFLGAILLGSNVSETIRKGIANPECFQDNPGLFMWGMTCVIQSVGFWLITACYFEMPVSTTHSTVGGVVGMTMMSRSSSCIIWGERTDTFPFITGVAGIVISWFLSPIVSGFAAAALYLLTYMAVLQWKEYSFTLAQLFFPFIVAITVGLNAAFFILKGSTGKSDALGTDKMVEEADNGDFSKVGAVSGIVAAVSFVLTALATPWMAKYASGKYIHKTDIPAACISTDAQVLSADQGDQVETAVAEIRQEKNDSLSYVMRELNTDPYAVLKTSKLIGGIHERVKRHDARTEEYFKFVQVFTAIVDSFSHGANDVANAMGPFAAVYLTFKHGMVSLNF
mmetsp:Transcript_63223/g.142588  ORF Transcript_63223/g.142588 Transcript_63223/m.142588 type:complete len:421 (+) Transcript_63223:50-1312(+)